MVDQEEYIFTPQLFHFLYYNLKVELQQQCATFDLYQPLPPIRDANTGF